MGAEKRPTDHLEPAPKKRGSERQITKDDVSEEEEQVSLLGEFKKHVDFYVSFKFQSSFEQ